MEANNQYIWFYVILSIIMTGLGIFLRAYLKEKAKSFATKEDLVEITIKVERIKAEFNRQQEFFMKRLEIANSLATSKMIILSASDGNEISVEIDKIYKELEMHSAILDPYRDKMGKLWEKVRDVGQAASKNPDAIPRQQLRDMVKALDELIQDLANTI